MKVTLCAGIAVAAALLIPTAHASGEGGTDGSGADGGGGVSVTPSTPAPGSQITLKVSGCGGRTATAASAAFVADAQLVGSGGTLSGDTQVRSSITAGAYDVQITCVDFKVKGRIEVVEPTSPGRSESDSLSESDGLTLPLTSAFASSATATPVAPVRAGGGGTAPLAAAEETRVRAEGHGPGTVQAVIGLVLVGVAATAVVFRGLRRRHRAD